MFTEKRNRKCKKFTQKGRILFRRFQDIPMETWIHRRKNEEN